MIFQVHGEHGQGAGSERCDTVREVAGSPPLYATGDYTFDSLAETLFDRGLDSKPTARRPSKAVAPSYFGRILRDKYYVGIVTYSGAEYPGRHELLVSESTFTAVQELLDSRGAAGERRRLHHHYLKGTLYCNSCHQRDIVHRMVIARSLGRSGNEYLYFFCAGRTTNDCKSRYINTLRVERAVADQYARIQLSPAFVQTARTAIRTALDKKAVADRQLQAQLKETLAVLSAKEENLLDLAADGTIARAKVRTRLTDIERQRERVTKQLSTVTSDLAVGVKNLEAFLDLLSNLGELYERADDEQRRNLNQAMFKKILVEDDEVTAEFAEPVASILASHEGYLALACGKTAEEAIHAAKAFHAAHTAQDKRATPSGGSSWLSVEDLCQGIFQVDVSNKTTMVDFGNHWSQVLDGTQTVGDATVADEPHRFGLPFLVGPVDSVLQGRRGAVIVLRRDDNEGVRGMQALGYREHFGRHVLTTAGDSRRYTMAGHGRSVSAASIHYHHEEPELWPEYPRR